MMSFDYVTETIYFQLKKQKFHTYFDSTPIFIYRKCNTKFDMEMPNTCGHVTEGWIISDSFLELNQEVNKSKMSFFTLLTLLNPNKHQ